jgi:hypothetical protein
MARTVLVPRERVARWFENFASRHGQPDLVVDAGDLVATAPDGARARAGLPFATSYDGPPDAVSLAHAVAAPRRWGVLLVRKGGFAMAAVEGLTVVDSKVGQRHVQGRTKAGGQSQQRFARRRANQARQAYEAAADHAARVLFGVEVLVCGGDRSAVDAVLEDPRLAALADVRVGPWLPVPDPRRAVLDRAVADAACVTIEITERAAGMAESSRSG